MKKIKYFFKGMLKNNYKLIIVYSLIIAAAFIKLDYQIYSPGGLIDLNKKVKIENFYESEGSFNLTYVRSRPGTILFILASYVIPSWDLVSLEDARIENESEEEINNRSKIYLNDVNKNAAIVAFDELGLNYNVEEIGISILHVYKSAKTDLKVGDIITSVDNITVRDVDEFSSILSSLKSSQRINLKVLRNNKEVDSYAIIQDGNGKTIIGISIANQKELTTNPKVEFKFKDNEIGPSGGLMTSLEIYDMLTKEDITKGRKISGTGTISINGEVGEISGIKYKLAGSVRKKADIFICPKGNYKECIEEKNKNNYDIEIIEADTFKNVLEKLK